MICFKYRFDSIVEETTTAEQDKTRNEAQTLPEKSTLCCNKLATNIYSKALESYKKALPK